MYNKQMIEHWKQLLKNRWIVVHHHCHPQMYVDNH
jgi:hypothetical protein